MLKKHPGVCWNLDPWVPPKRLWFGGHKNPGICILTTISSHCNATVYPELFKDNSIRNSKRTLHLKDSRGHYLDLTGSGFKSELCHLLAVWLRNIPLKPPFSFVSIEICIVVWAITGGSTRWKADGLEEEKRWGAWKAQGSSSLRSSITISLDYFKKIFIVLRFSYYKKVLKNQQYRNALQGNWSSPWAHTSRKKQTPLRVWECLFLCKHKQKWEQAEILFCNFAVFAFGDMSRGYFFTG